MDRVARVRPDLPAVDREFDYLVPDAMARDVHVGTIVRVPLHGRRVRGWVGALGVEPETAADLRPILAVSSDGPPPEVMELCAWTAWRYAGPVVHVLRAASPPNAARVEPPPARPPGAAAAPSRAHLEWPPAADRKALVADLVARAGSSIVVTPAPGRSGPLARALAAGGRRVVAYGGTDAERTAAWRAATRGNCVIIGGRIAVFAPVPDLAALVVLDEHDEALQEERVPTWHAREVAAERAARARAALTLVTPVPTPEGEALAGPLRRADRAAARNGWPIVEIVDQRDGPPRGLLTEPLAAALHRAIDAGGRAACVVNRKGRARLLACANCNELARCEHCGTAVIDDGAQLVCPRGDAPRPRVCAHCSSTKLKVLRAGVTRVLEELSALLPRATVADVDAATEAVPGADVYVGTEAVLHRLGRAPNRPVRLVAFLDFDQELLASRLRATQLALALLARGARLVGPRTAGGRLLVQTHVPDHPVVQAAFHADVGAVLDEETARLRALGYPPFGGLAELRGAPDAVRIAADGAAAGGARVMGPRTVGERSEALVVHTDPGALADALAPVLAPAKAAGRLRVAVEPVRL